MNTVSRHGKDDDEEENSRVHAKTGTSAPENDDTGLRKNSKGRNEKPTFTSQRTLRWNDCRLRSCRRKLILPLRLRCSAAALIIVWARGIDPGFKIQLIYIVTHIHTRCDEAGTNTQRRQREGSEQEEPRQRGASRCGTMG